MKQRARRSAGLLVALSFVACTTFTLIKAEPQVIGKVYQVHPTTEWSRTELGEVEIWTVDGIVLEALYFTRGLEDGAPLFKPPPFSDEVMPEFRAGKSPNDAMDFVVDSLARNGMVNLRTEGLRPFPMGERTGFRFELTGLSEAGLQLRGVAVGSEVEGRLYLILYLGASLHYYERYLKEVEAIIESVEWI